MQTQMVIVYYLLNGNFDPWAFIGDSIVVAPGGLTAKKILICARH